MTYLKSLFFNFLIVFFANHVLPGIEAGEHKLPQVGPDLIFALVLGLLNSLVYPIMKLTGRQATLGKITLSAIVINFAAYAILKVAPLGIQVESFEGYASASALVAFGSFLTNYLEMRHGTPKMPKPPAEPPHAP